MMVEPSWRAARAPAAFRLPFGLAPSSDRRVRDASRDDGRFVLRLLILLLVLTLSAPASAQLLSRQIHGSLETVQEAIAERDYDRAERILERLLERNLASFELAIVQRTRGYLEAERDNYPAAISAFEAALAADGLEERAQNDLRLIIGQLYLATDRIEEGVARLAAWYAEATDPEPQEMMTYAQALAQTDDFDGAIEIAAGAIAADPAPQQSWLEFLASLYLLRERPAEAIPVALDGLALYPRAKQLWLYLASAYFEVDRLDRALAVMQMMHGKGLIDQGSQYVFLAQLHLQAADPYFGARILDGGLDSRAVAAEPMTLDLLASAWEMARELDRAVAPLERAAQTAEEGELYARLGHLQMRREAFGEAAAAYAEALERGDLANSGEITLWRGVALARAGREAAALTAFRAAGRIPALRDQARAWIERLEPGS